MLNHLSEFLFAQILTNLRLGHTFGFRVPIKKARQGIEQDCDERKV